MSTATADAWITEHTGLPASVIRDWNLTSESDGGSRLDLKVRIRLLPEQVDQFLGRATDA